MILIKKAFKNIVEKGNKMIILASQRKKPYEKIVRKGENSVVWLTLY